MEQDERSDQSSSGLDEKTKLERQRTRLQRRVIKAAARNNDNYFIDKWFIAVYESEFCKESWERLTVDWTYEQFLEMANHVAYSEELKYAREMDNNREEEAARKHQELSSKYGRSR